MAIAAARWRSAIPSRCALRNGKSPSRQQQTDVMFLVSAERRRGPLAWESWSRRGADGSVLSS